MNEPIERQVVEEGNPFRFVDGSTGDGRKRKGSEGLAPSIDHKLVKYANGKFVIETIKVEKMIKNNDGSYTIFFKVLIDESNFKQTLNYEMKLNDDFNIEALKIV